MEQLFRSHDQRTQCVIFIFHSNFGLHPQDIFTKCKLLISKKLRKKLILIDYLYFKSTISQR